MTLFLWQHWHKMARHPVAADVCVAVVSSIVVVVVVLGVLVIAALLKADVLVVLLLCVCARLLLVSCCLIFKNRLHQPHAARALIRVLRRAAAVIAVLEPCLRCPVHKTCVACSSRSCGGWLKHLGWLLSACAGSGAQCQQHTTTWLCLSSSCQPLKLKKKGWKSLAIACLWRQQSLFRLRALARRCATGPEDACLPALLVCSCFCSLMSPIFMWGGCSVSPSQVHSHAQHNRHGRCGL